MHLTSTFPELSSLYSSNLFHQILLHRSQMTSLPQSLGKKQKGCRLISTTLSEQFRAECVRHMAKKAFWKELTFVWKHGETFSASSHIKWSLLCSRGRLQQRTEGRMDESPTTITFISHRHRCEEDASDPCQINWGLFSYETQTEGKVITFLTSSKQFLHLLVGPSGLLFFFPLVWQIISNRCAVL